MNHHYCSFACAAASSPCGLCIAQDQAATDSRKRSNGKPTLTHNPFATLFRIVKACGCGRGFTASAWASLPYVGVQKDDSGACAELRNCSKCRSTIALELHL